MLYPLKFSNFQEISNYLKNLHQFKIFRKSQTSQIWHWHDLVYIWLNSYDLQIFNITFKKMGFIRGYWTKPCRLDHLRAKLRHFVLVISFFLIQLLKEIPPLHESVRQRAVNRKPGSHETFKILIKNQLLGTTRI